jgi:hypothetical protein
MKLTLTARRLILAASLVASVAGAFSLSHSEDDSVVAAVATRSRTSTLRMAEGAYPGETRARVARTTADTGSIAVLALKPRHFDTDAGDLFAVPAPAVPAQSNLKPVAPPLPFTFLGRIVDGDRVAVMLGQTSGETIVAHQGDEIGSSYRLDDVGNSALTFIYLPLRQKQTLALIDTEASADFLKNGQKSNAQ